MTRVARQTACVVLLVTTAGCHDPDAYRLLSPTNPSGTPVESILDIVAQGTAIRADGGSRTRIEARLDPSATVRTVAFTTTNGTLFARGKSSSDAAPTLSVDADSNGVAAVELQATTQPGTATVTAAISVPNTTPPRTITRSVDITFVAAALDEVITLTIAPTTVAADGSSRVHLVATMSQSVAAVTREVIFTATNGAFATGQDNGNEKRARIAVSGTAAAVDLVAPDTPGPVSLTAEVTGFTARGLITFGRALPDTIFVETTLATVSRTSGTATITVQLLRDIGRVSDNTVVVYTATDSTGAAIGAFSDVKLASASNGKVTSTAAFDPLDTAAPGPATITATVGSVTGTIAIELTN
jgi:hypothetical protein